MATLIRLKQIESGSSLSTAASVGADFSSSVNEIVSQSIESSLSASIIQIILNNVGTVLPEGVISSSIQVDLLQTTNFDGFSSSISNSFFGVYSELTSISNSFELGLSASNTNTNTLFTQLSQSVGLELSASSANTIQLFNELSSSVELQFSASNSNSNDISVSVNARLVNLEQFSSSLDSGFATDAELTLTSSQIIDQGEF